MAFIHPALSSDIAFNISHSYRNVNIGQTISPWEHIVFLSLSRKLVRPTPKMICPSDTFSLQTILIDKNEQQIYVEPLQIIYENLKL